MKEDAQLICPISYDDPDDQWKRLEPLLNERLPLRDVSWKNPISSTFITINKLPLRFLPSSSSLFKDTDHSFRWFLSPYVYVYLLVAESMDAYKVLKPTLKKWVDARNNATGTLGKSPWLIIHIPVGNHSSEVYKKIFAKISGDFYVDRSGDRSIMMPILPEGQTSVAASSLSFFISTSPQFMTDAYNDFSSKMREGIVQSFQHRSFLYDADIRRLDQTRGTPMFDFRQYFLVKESLALLLQMMQLPEMALAQYEELEASLSYCPAGCLIDNDWPIAPPDPLKTSDKSVQDGSNLPSQQSLSAASSKEKDNMSDAVKNGEDVASYSINLSRMKILRNKMSLIELYKYVFARQLFFLITLRRLNVCAKRSLQYMVFSSDYIEKRILQSVSNPRTSESTLKSTSEIAVQLKQLHVWAVTGAVKLTRMLRDLLQKKYRDPTGSSSNNSSQDNIEALMASTASIQLTAEQEAEYKDTMLNVTEILQFAIQRYRLLSPIGHYAYPVYLNRISNFQDSFFGIQRNYFDETVAESDSNKENTVLLKQKHAAAYFQCFNEDGKSLNMVILLSKELEAMKFLEDYTTEQLLEALAQKLRSISHYWAKIYLQENTFGYDQDGDYINLVRKVNNLSKSNYEKGRVLEVITFLLFQRTLIDLYHLCDRNNLAIFHKLQMNYVTLITDQYTMNSLVLNHILTTSFLTKSFDQTNGNCGMITTSKASGKSIASLVINSNIALHRWRDMILQCLITLLYGSEQLRDSLLYKQVLGWLILYPIKEYCGSYEYSAEDLLIQWAHSLLPESIPSNSVPPSFPIISKELLRPVQNSSPVSSFLMLSDNFFQFSFSPITKEATNLISFTKSFHRGYQMIEEEKFPVKVIKVDCAKRGNTVMLQIISSLSQPIKCDKVQFVFKKIHADSFRFNVKSSGKSTPLPSNIVSSTNGNNASAPGTPTPNNTPTLTSSGHKHYNPTASSLIDLEGDEFLCTPLSSYQDSAGLFTILPGKQQWQLHFYPTSLGEYAFDRSIICVNYLQLYSKPLYHQLIHCSDFSIKDIYQSEQFISLEHSSVANYFQRYPLLQIQSPPSFAQAQIHTTISSPSQQKDDCWIKLRFQEPITLESLSLKIHGLKEEDGTHGKNRKLSNGSFASLLPSSSTQSMVVSKALKRTLSLMNFTALNHNNTMSSYVELVNNSNGIKQNEEEAIMVSLLPQAIDSSTVPVGGAEIHFSSPTTDWTIRKVPTIASSSSSQYEKESQERMNQSVIVPILLHENYVHDGGKYVHLQQLGEINEISFRVKYSSVPKTTITSSQRELWTQLHLLMEGHLQCGHCHIPFQLNTTELISVSNLLTVTTKEPNVIAFQDGIQSYLLQCSLQNHTKCTLVICGFTVISFSDTPAKRVTHLECFKAPKCLAYAQTPPTFPFEETLELSEEVVYHAGFGIKAKCNQPFSMRFYYYRKEDVAFCHMKDQDYPSIFYTDIAINYSSEPPIPSLVPKAPSLAQKKAENIESSSSCPWNVSPAYRLQDITVGQVTKIYAAVWLGKHHNHEERFDLEKLHLHIHHVYSYISNDELMFNVDCMDDKLTLPNLRRNLHVEIFADAKWIPVSIKLYPASKYSSTNCEDSLPGLNSKENDLLFAVEMTVIPIECGKCAIPGLQITSCMWEQYHSSLTQTIIPDVRYFDNGQILVHPLLSNTQQQQLNATTSATTFRTNVDRRPMIISS